MSFKALSQYPKLQATDDSDLGSNASLSASQSSLSGRSIPMSWAYMELIHPAATQLGVLALQHHATYGHTCEEVISGPKYARGQNKSKCVRLFLDARAN